MTEPTTESLSFPLATTEDLLTPILRQGAQQLLAQAIDAEVADYLSQRAGLVNDHGQQLVVRNGHLPQRDLQTPVGDIPIRQPRVRDRRLPDQRETFNSNILPRYLRRTKAIEQLIPWLYLKGVSTGDFTDALQALLGPQAKGLSPTTITRLKATWEDAYRQWSQQSLAGKRYVYLWADGVYFNIRLEDEGRDRQCILVLMGATPQGRKELLAVVDGYRESEASWTELLVSLKHRGLMVPPKLAVGDGALGFWAALRKVFPTTLAQRCWVHKMANVLNKMPKSVQGKAKQMLHEIWMAEAKAQAMQAFDRFVAVFQAKHPAAVACLEKDRDALLAFYEFPAEHWKHLRTTNPIESTFATVRLRTAKTKGSGSRIACLTMVFKLAQAAEKHWRRLNGHELLDDVIAGVEFIDGVKNEAA